MKKQITLSLILFIAFFCKVHAQEMSISGLVSSKTDNLPLPGVNIVIEGTSKGTSTDFDGNYTIKAKKGDVLVFSFIGYSDQKIKVTNQSIINVALEENTSSLEEVVIIGYGGTVTRKDVTGSISKANLKTALETSNVSLAQALQGSVAGLNVGTTTSAGASPVISIRGRNTLSGSSADNQPLIVLDGIIYRGSLVDLNPADIESTEVLKDASSAAIYGSQASNGVILVTSKSGRKSRKPVFNFSSSYSIQSPTKNIRPMQAAEYETFFPDIYWDVILSNPNFYWRQGFKTLAISEGYENGVDSKWWDTFTDPGQIQTQNINVSGASESINYFLGAGYTNQAGFIKNDDYKRYNFRVNLDAKLNDWLKIGTQNFATVSDYSGRSPDPSIPFFLQPWAPERDANGEFLTRPEGLWLNPHLTVQTDDYDVRFNIFNNIHADVNLPLEGLTYKMNYSNNYRTIDQRQFDPYAANFTGVAFHRNYKYWDWTFDNIVNYKKTFAENHNFDLTLVYGVEKRDLNYVGAQAENFAVDFLGYDRLQAGDPSLNQVSSSREGEASLYQMGRLLYNYKNKYFFTGTVRRDGFSGFGSNKKFGVFPSIALGWTVTEEDFLKEQEWLNFLKARVSYGQTGRRAVGRYQTLAKVDSSVSYIFGDGGTASQGQSISSLANNNLGWETTTGINAGLDFEVLNSRITGTVEYYKNNTNNILYSIALPNVTGFNSIFTNIAETSNHGLDITLTGKIIDQEDFKWETTLSYNRVRNKVESIIGADNDGDGVEDDLPSSGLFIGHPIGTIYDYEIIGMWQLEDQENGDLWSGFFPGTYKLRDVNGDGKISSLDDRSILGYQDPAYRVGLANTVTYKDFQLYLFFNSIQGGKDMYLGSDDPYNVGNWVKRDNLLYSNVPSGAWDYWLPNNPNAKYRRLDTGSSYGGRYYKQRNFVRLQDITLSYNLPRHIAESIKLSNLKLFLSGKNVATWTKWSGQDPETGVGLNPAYPLLKSYTLGVNVQF